jgi:hypothetical protein
VPKVEEKSTGEEAPYLPTKTEMALLEVMLNPLNRLKNVEELCKMVPCDKGTYYNAFKKPGFVKLYREESLNLITKGLSSIVNSVVREASRGSAQHAKIALVMAGEYTEKTASEITGKNGGPIQTDTTVVERPRISREEWEKRHGLV